MNTFKNIYGKELTVEKHGRGRLLVTMRSDGSENSRRAYIFDKKIAAELMLEIARAADIVHHDPDDTPYDSSQRTENMGDLNIAAHYLASHVSQAEKAAHNAAKEAADREVLEAEAFALYAGAPFTNGIKSFAALSEGAQHQWLTIARTAREIHKAVS